MNSEIDPHVLHSEPAVSRIFFFRVALFSLLFLGESRFLFRWPFSLFSVVIDARTGWEISGFTGHLVFGKSKNGHLFDFDKTYIIRKL